jgi:hypothetical protein
MATKSFTAMRRFAGILFTLIFACACLSVGAAGQSPLVVASAATGMTHPTGWGTIYQTALDTKGDWLVNDYSNGALYEFPANGGPVITLVVPGGLGGGNNPGVAVDAFNNLYLEGNWSNCLVIYKYDTATNTWPGLAALTPTSGTSGCSPAIAQYSALNNSTQPYWNWGFQPWGLAVDQFNNLVIANQTDSNFMFYLPVIGPGTATPSEGEYDVLLGTMEARATSEAVDPEENVYLVEEQDQKLTATPNTCPSGTCINGVLEIPQTLSLLPNNPTTSANFNSVPANEKSLANVAPAALANTSGVCVRQDRWNLPDPQPLGNAGYGRDHRAHAVDWPGIGRRQRKSRHVCSHHGRAIQWRGRCRHRQFRVRRVRRPRCRNCQCDAAANFVRV